MMGRLKLKEIYFIQGILILSLTLALGPTTTASVSIPAPPTSRSLKDNVSKLTNSNSTAETTPPTSTLPPSKESILSPPINKPPSDDKSYRGLTLPNGLQVLLILDPNATKAAASLTVGAGSLNNPRSLPGLAHFVEHAVYLGDAKYPEENGFSKFLSANGGSDNALTYEDYTTYYFDVAPSALNSALDRFAQLFISPLFRESSLEKEVNAINSENEKNIPSDSRRIFRVERETADPKHDLSVFVTGNRETLWTLPRSKGVNMSEALQGFFQKYYSSNIMRLAVLGSQSLDEMQSSVEEIFSPIPNKEIAMPYWSDPPYGEKELQTKIEIVPQSDLRALYFTIPIPYSVPHYKTNPAGYITNLIGHEGEGSLLSLLKKKNLATALETGSWENRGFMAMRVQIALTSEGLNNTEEVVCHVFEYIQMLKDLGPQKWYWEEMKDINSIGYQFKDKTEATSLLTSYSSKMLSYPLEDVISAGIVLSEYKPRTIREVLNSLTPERTRITLLSKQFESRANITEKYYGVKYNVEKIDPSIIKKWKECKKNKDLFYPTKNEFIPVKFAMKERVEKPGIIPIIINETDISRIWFLQDNEFFLPKAIVSVEMYSPMAYVDPLSVWLNFMFSSFVEDALSEFSYNAYLTDLSYSISSFPYGIRLRVDGYDDKLGVLLLKIIETMTKLEMLSVNPDRFESFRDSYLRKLKNHENDQPKERAKTKLSELLRDKYWSYEDLMSVAQDVTIERVAAFSKGFLSRLKFTWLFYGNLEPSEALKMASSSQDLFDKIGTQPILPSQIIRLRDVEVPQGTDWIYKMSQSSHSSSSIIIFYQLGSLQNNQESVMAEFLDQLTHQSFYDQLRTQEQLGYTVGTTTRSFEATKAFQFVVQGERHPAYVQSRIDKFIKDFEAKLNNMTETQFEEYKDSFKAVLKSHKPKTLFERYQTAGKEIVSERFHFDGELRQREELEKLTLEEFQKFYQDNFGQDSKIKRKISIHVISRGEGGAGKNITQEDKILADEIDLQKKEIGMDLTEWKKQRKLYPTH